MGRWEDVRTSNVGEHGVAGLEALGGLLPEAVDVVGETDLLGG